MIDNTGSQKIMEQAEILASFTDIDYGVSRAYLTKEHKAAHQQIAQWMQQAGLSVWQDSVGNQWGRKAASNPIYPTLIIGSHSDTVVNAGKYDGTLGVLLAIAALDAIQHHDLPFHVDVVAFADEEGTRFNTTLIGSSAVAGQFDKNWLAVKDADGISMGEAMQAFGLDPQLAGLDQRQPDQVMSYLEVHIEQGPVLEKEQLAVGVVTGIAGAKRYQMRLAGTAGHAGTVPMGLRQDALACAAEMMLKIESYALEKQIVATVGKCQVAPSAVNVIPGEVVFTLDIRSQHQPTLEASCDALFAELEVIAARRQIGFDKQKLYQAQAVPCSDKLQQQWAQVVEKQTGKPALFLSSGAGHDAMVMANITDMGMLFVRCEKGISHNPREKVEEADVQVALDCLVQMLKGFIDNKERSAKRDKPVSNEAESAPLFGLGIGGNSAGHLTQTGEIQGFGKVTDASLPQALFPFYVPHAEEAYLARDPYSFDTLILPNDPDALVQMEPELAIKATVSYDSDNKVIALAPFAITLVNDVSYRNAKVTKLAQKKNWDKACKGIASHSIKIDGFTQAQSLDHYRLCGFHHSHGQWQLSADEVSVSDYTYFYGELLDWIMTTMNKQSSQGIQHNIADLLAQSGYPKEILVSVGAARYSAYGESHRLVAGDKTLVVLFNSQKYTYHDIVTLIEKTQALEGLSNDDVIFLSQTVIR